MPTVAHDGGAACAIGRSVYWPYGSHSMNSSPKRPEWDRVVIGREAVLGRSNSRSHVLYLGGKLIGVVNVGNSGKSFLVTRCISNWPSCGTG